ncbi:MAG: hypothetical protein J5I59_05630 [Saprospiraceae bacterium]|nr:hypothetical protein [Saprospiraceae bacterium]
MFCDWLVEWAGILDGITSVKYTSSDTELEIRDMPEWLKKACRAVKVAANDVWGFIAAEGCGDATNGGYNLGCAWDNAGNKSDSVP